MNPKFPGIPEGLDHFRFGSQILILAIFHIPFVHKGLEVTPLLNPIRRVDIDHLHLTGRALLFQKGVHHQQAVSGHKAV